MKPAFGIFFLVFLLQFKFTFGQKENNSVLDKRISIEIRNESISTILDTISQQAHVFFSYNASLIEAEKKPTSLFSIKPFRKPLIFCLIRSLFTKHLTNKSLLPLRKLKK